ncbi:unnamed protein product [Ixodes persulcatus]
MTATKLDPWSDQEAAKLGDTWAQETDNGAVCWGDDASAMNSAPRPEGRRTTRRVRNGKRDKGPKNDPFRFEGEGVSFKAKLIGSETVDNARGDRMCQDAMQRLKAAVRASGEHKQRVVLAVSLQGIKIRDDKSGELVFHHPVHKISFISQDTSDARAFGYVCVSDEGCHQFVAIKTEKTASQLVIALRDLFQVVLEMKQHEMRLAREEQQQQQQTCRSSASQMHTSKSTDFSLRGEAQEVLYEAVSGAREGLSPPPEAQPQSPEGSGTPTVDDLLDLQSELDSLQQGIQQMETTIAAAATLASPVCPDPFDTSFVTDPGQASRAFFSQPATPVGPAPPLLPPPPPARPASSCASVARVAPPPFAEQRAPERRPPRSLAFAPPAPPPHRPTSTVSLPPTPLPDLFAELDPLGGGRPQQSRADFFRDVKSPPRRVLRDLYRDGSSGSADVASLASCGGWETFEEETAPPPSFPPPPLPDSSSSGALASPPVAIPPPTADEGFCSGSNASSVSPSLPLGATPLLLPGGGSGDIFSRSKDPFADEFFAAPAAAGFQESPALGGFGSAPAPLLANGAMTPGGSPWLLPPREASFSR